MTGTRLSPPDHAEQRPVLVARPRRRPRRPADAVDRVAQRIPAAVAGPARSRCTRPASTLRHDVHDRSPSIQWTPVQHASYYELDVVHQRELVAGRHAGLQDRRHDVRATCQQRLRLAPGGNLCTGGCDRSTTLPGQRPPRHLTRFQQAFKWTTPAPPGGAMDHAAVVTDLKIAVNGRGIATAATAARPGRRTAASTSVRRRADDPRALVGPGAGRHVLPPSTTRRT